MRDVNSIVFGQAGPVRQADVGLWRNAEQIRTDPPLTLTPASWALGQAGDGGDQDRAKHKAYHAHRGKDKTLPAGQAFAFGIAEEVRKFLVDLDYWQEPGEAGAEAPNGPMLLRCWHGHPEERRTGEREAEHPIEHPECVGADTETGDILNGTRQNVGQSRFCLAFPHPA